MFSLHLFRNVTGLRNHSHNPPAAAHPGGFWDMLFSDVEQKVKLHFPAASFAPAEEALCVCVCVV